MVTVVQRRKVGNKKSRNPRDEMSTPNAQSVAGYFVGRGNRERRQSLAFLQSPSRMHAFDRTFCLLAKAMM
jgi:hypothetical protein